MTTYPAPRSFSIFFLLLLIAAGPARAEYAEWKHRASLFVLTTPEGADVPEDVTVSDFPVLVRLHADFFDFSQAQAQGEDIRFSTPAGAALAFEIDHWDPAAGKAGIWLRIPEIRGQARQEIRMHWGKADAASASDGAAVFNASNGYVAVWHMQDSVEALGGLKTVDTGTAAGPGRIGRGRSFTPGKGLHCGEDIALLPAGAEPHSTEAWFRSETPNSTLIGWGLEKGQGKVVMQYASPPHIRMDCYFSNGTLRGETRIEGSRWNQVLFSYTSGDVRLYVNGELDQTNSNPRPPLNIQRPARLYMGGWYRRYRYEGELDEVRISSVARSAHWARLQFENQKAMHRLVGPLVHPGEALSVAPKTISVLEGKSITLRAEVKGAQKLYWILQRDGAESIVAVDRRSHTFDAGRVSGDAAFSLQLKAVFPDETRVLAIPVQVKEAIPDPVFALEAPERWDGRKTIDVIPRLANAEAMEAAGVAGLKTEWKVSGLATIKQVLPDRLRLTRAQNSGALEVSCTVDNGGGPVSASVRLAVQEPDRDPWVYRVPGQDEQPVEGQFYARDDQNEGTLHYNGAYTNRADTVFLRVFADDTLHEEQSQKPRKGGRYAFTVKVQPGLIRYRVEFGCTVDGKETVLRRVGDLLCGDAYLIDGQSNALATDIREDAPRETHAWVRSYGRPRYYREGERENLWCRPVWKAGKEHHAELGWWGMELAKRLVEDHQVPIFMVNAAVGGTRIDQHQRNEADPTDLETIYGRMLWRLREAKLTHGIRAVIWHQGENDQGAAGPDGGYGWESYQKYFVAMSAAWKRDLPNLQRTYLFQIWPNACSMGGGNGDMLREVQRTLPFLYANMEIQSTLGIDPPGGCHFPFAGWTRFADLVQPLIDRDFYGKKSATPLTAPNLLGARFTSAARDTIALEFDQPVAWEDALVDQFYLDDVKDLVVSGTAAGNRLTLRLKEASTALRITYLKETSWKREKLLRGANGIAALSFCRVPVQAAP